MKKQQRLTYYRQMDQLLLQMEIADQEKYEFVTEFFKKELQIDDFDSKIAIEPMELKSFLFLVFSVLVKYEMSQPKFTVEIPPIYIRS